MNTKQLEALAAMPPEESLGAVREMIGRGAPSRRAAAWLRRLLLRLSENDAVAPHLRVAAVALRDRIDPKRARTTVGVHGAGAPSAPAGQERFHGTPHNPCRAAEYGLACTGNSFEELLRGIEAQESREAGGQQPKA